MAPTHGGNPTPNTPAPAPAPAPAPKAKAPVPNTWDPAVTGETTYVPSPGELAAVEWMQRNGAPKTVYFIVGTDRYPGGAIQDFFVRFVKGNQYVTVESRGIQSTWGAYYSLIDLKRGGILDEPPPVVGPVITGPFNPPKGE